MEKRRVIRLERRNRCKKKRIRTCRAYSSTQGNEKQPEERPRSGRPRNHFRSAWVAAMWNHVVFARSDKNRTGDVRDSRLKCGRAEAGTRPPHMMRAILIRLDGQLRRFFGLSGRCRSVGAVPGRPAAIRSPFLLRQTATRWWGLAWSRWPVV